MHEGVCRGCLSSGRQLEPLQHEEWQYFLSLLIDDIGDEVAVSPLCWECAGGVRGALRLRARARRAHRIVRSMTKDSKETQLSTLSCLTWVSLGVTYYMTHEETIEEPLFVNIDGDVDDDGGGRDDYDDDHEFKELVKSEILKLNTLTPVNGKKQPKKRKRRKANGTELEANGTEIGANGTGLGAHGTGLGANGTGLGAKGTGWGANGTEEGVNRLKEEAFDSSDDEPLTAKKIKKENGVSEKKTRKATGKRGAQVAARVAALGLPPGALHVTVLTWEQVEEERARALAAPRYCVARHRCERCALGFNHQHKLQAHLEKHLPSAGSLPCGACGVRCRNRHALAAHTRRHRVRWQCGQCGALWSRAAVAADHFARAHAAPAAPAPTHRCPSCEHVATSLGRLRSHMKEHGERARCHLCPKTFRDRASLRTHLFIHRGEKEFSCGECGKQFLFKTALQLHQLTHQQHQHLYCHQCDVTFKNHMSLYQHMKYNLKHIDPAKLKHECGECGVRFARASRLAEHRAAAHTRARPVRCRQPHCTYACASGAVLRAHVRAVHRGQRAKRDHVCHRCGNAYTSKKTLEGHLRAHAGERPYACADCPATFTYHAALYNHTRGVHRRKPGAARESAARGDGTAHT